MLYNGKKEAPLSAFKGSEKLRFSLCRQVYRKKETSQRRLISQVENKRKEKKHGKTEEEAVEATAVARNLETEDKAEMLETGLTYCLADVSSILAYPSPQCATRMELKTYVSSHNSIFKPYFDISLFFLAIFMILYIFDSPTIYLVFQRTGIMSFSYL